MKPVLAKTVNALFFNARLAYGLYAPDQGLMARRGQRGFSLMVVLMVLVVIGVLGVAAGRIGVQGQQSARNDRDYLIAQQAAQAALDDAVREINHGTNAVRKAALRGETPQDEKFILCGTGNPAPSGQDGLCNDEMKGTQWLTVNMLDPDSPYTVALGTYTGRTYQAGEAGMQPAHKPRYLIEKIPNPDNASCEDSTAAPRTHNLPCAVIQRSSYSYQITAVGFGPTEKTTAIVQMVYQFSDGLP